MAIRWALSTTDWHKHAVDEHANHPLGVYKAQCGHLLPFVVSLGDEPIGRVCTACAGTQYDAAIKGGSP